jgi:hypothetical protein
METPPTRIVSHSEYLLHLGLQTFLSLGLLLIGLTFMAGVALVDLIWSSVVLAEAIETPTIPFVGELVLLLTASLCFFLSTIGWEYLRQVYERQPPVQLLRGCPASQPCSSASLLRASDKPISLQKTSSPSR